SKVTILKRLGSKSAADETNAELVQLIREKSGEPIVYSQAQFLQRLGEYSGATLVLEDYIPYLKKLPKEQRISLPGSLYLLAQLHLKQNELDKAIADYDYLLSIYPANGTPWDVPDKV